MKKQFLIIALLFLNFAAFAQPGMQGMRISTFGGVAAGMENPALLAEVRNRFDINIFNLNYTLENSDIKLNWRDILSDQKITLDAGSFDDFSLKNIIEFQGPSAMFSLKNKIAFGFSTRIRSFTQFNSLDFSLAQPFLEGRAFDISQDGKIVEPYMNINLQTFADFGVSAAMQVVRAKKHNLYAGATARIYRGVFAADFTGQNIDIDLDQALNDSILNLNADLQMQASVPVSADFFNGNSAQTAFLTPGDVVNTLFNEAAGSGFGFDLGVAYDGELLNKKVRASLSITDIGSVKYNKGRRYGASFVANNVVINKDSLRDYPGGSYDSLKAYAASYGVLIDTTTGNSEFSQALPTQINLFADVQILKGFYLGLMTAFDATSDGKPKSNYSTYTSLIPRFQSKAFEAWLPITYNAFSKQAKVGFGARLSAFYFGSNNISDLIQGEAKGFNFYLGTRVTNLRAKKRDEKNKGQRDK